MKKIKMSSLPIGTAILETDSLPYSSAIGLQKLQLSILGKAIYGSGNFTGNIDDLTKGGTYVVTLASTGVPTGVITGGVIVVFESKGSGNRSIQLFVQNNTSTIIAYLRYKHDVGYTPWRQVSLVSI